jgi:hypothetical protein
MVVRLIEPYVGAAAGPIVASSRAMNVTIVDARKLPLRYPLRCDDEVKTGSAWPGGPAARLHGAQEAASENKRVAARDIGGRCRAEGDCGIMSLGDVCIAIDRPTCSSRH